MTLYQLHPITKLLILLASGWEWAGSDLRYPHMIWLKKETIE